MRRTLDAAEFCQPPRVCSRRSSVALLLYMPSLSVAQLSVWCRYNPDGDLAYTHSHRINVFGWNILSIYSNHIFIALLLTFACIPDVSGTHTVNRSRFACNSYTQYIRCNNIQLALQLNSFFDAAAAAVTAADHIRNVRPAVEYAQTDCVNIFDALHMNICIHSILCILYIHLTLVHSFLAGVVPAAVIIVDLNTSYIVTQTVTQIILRNKSWVSVSVSGFVMMCDSKC